MSDHATAAIRIELSGVPHGKGRPRFARATGHTYTPAATRSYEAALRYAAQEAMAGRAPLEGALSLRVEAYLPVPSSWSRKRQLLAMQGAILPIVRPDHDNLTKPTDALNAIVWRDDSQITDVTFRKRYSDRPRLVLIVEPVVVGLHTPSIDGLRKRMAAARENGVAA